MQRWHRMLMSVLLLTAVSSCSVLPHAPGLSSPAWQAHMLQQADYQRQDQVEVLWNNHGFSFLLYQQQQGSQLELLALSLTGQQLFKLNFDGQRVQVEQRIAQMKLLPFEFVVRDILFATYPNFIQLQKTDQVQLKANHQSQEIWINQSKVLTIQQVDDGIELDNGQVPYQMSFHTIANTLQNNE